ncbi:NUDIX hydrolase [Roseospirillum parvum]|uniref:8-oxo-dGTP pyrophosphatase MutT, NUDIX family n=1 Tax=Roseospirillum parvum TaxID=83401 RepID=A0A1G7U758_9PROT|nr:NUDIX domain-containing protein [Roseospirillum parvum]SDG42879.1 8-oxo-dGTP pyrophosphatase MutT, NUDIX family [Roseospirillum parvum]
MTWRSVFEAVVLPMVRRPRLFQVAALCHRQGHAGPEVLLVTSRETGRWVLPKGWPVRGLDAAGAAVEEAWEEAGVRPAPGRPRPVGRYRYAKRLKGGLPVETEVAVFAVAVAKLADTFPEVGSRERRWMTPAKAAEAVDEPDLKTLLRALPPLAG